MAAEKTDATVARNRPCDLCSLPVGKAPFRLLTSEGEKYFCCKGCEGIYEMLHEAMVIKKGTES